MVKHPFFQFSKCKNSYLHRFKIEEEYEDGVIEVCEICKLRKFFKIIDNKVNNKEYMDFHFRNILPHNHPMYYHENEYNPLEETISPYA